MGKIKLLFDVVNDLRSLSDSIECLAQAMADGDNDPKDERQENNAKAETTVSEQKKTPSVTHEMLRNTAVTLSQNGKRADVKKLLETYGVTNISAVADEDLEAFYADLKSMEEVSEDAAD